ncbi:MAG TPA: ScyD/ScyE family protein [Opitutaceae bacterium]
MISSSAPQSRRCCARQPDSDLRPVFIAGLLAALALPVAASAAAWDLVATGLNNPRGLDFAPNGALYVAEAGTGGDGPAAEGPDGPVYFGLSGSITRIFKGKQGRVVEGLPSTAGEGGFGAIGPSDISFEPFGRARVTIGLGLNPAVRDSVFGPAGAKLGGLFQLSQNGKLKWLADLAAFEASANPDQGLPDSNPNGVLSTRAGGAYVADAGANTLLHVTANGAVSVVAVFPSRVVDTPPFLPQPPFPAQLIMQAVPTNVVRGPDGALYVSQLTGFPFPPGEARIYRVVPGSAPQVYAEGFTNIIDLEFDGAGNLYVLEIDANSLANPAVGGRLARINAADGSVETIADDGLIMPGGLSIGPDGAIYVTNFGTSPGGGQVVRIEP